MNSFTTMTLSRKRFWFLIIGNYAQGNSRITPNRVNFPRGNVPEHYIPLPYFPSTLMYVSNRVNFIYLKMFSPQSC